MVTADLEQFQNSRNLVSIRRLEIDERKIQGFLLGYSDTIVLITYVYDFNLDGLMLFRLADLSDVSSNRTDEHQTEMLKREGSYEHVDFDIKANLKNWASVFSTLGKHRRLVTIEDENPDDAKFYIGEIQMISSKSVEILEFDGTGNWENKPTRVHFDDISCVQIGNKYADMYEQDFER